MGTQGEIYNIYGIVHPAEIHSRNGKDDRGHDSPVVYAVNGKLVSHDEEAEDIDIEAGVFDNLHSSKRGSPELSVRILGHDTGEMAMGSRHFDGKALIGYVVGNESYTSKASPLLPLKDIQALAPKLVKDIKATFGIEARESDLQLFLLYDWQQ